MRTVLVTGVTGFIGRNTARLFHESGWNVIGIGTQPPENAPRQSLAKYEQFLLPSSDLKILLTETQPDVCVHCAGRASVGYSLINPAEDFKNSLAVTFDLLENIRLYSPKCKIVYLSSAAVYGNPESLPIEETQTPQPISPYGFHKYMCEQLCSEYSIIYGLSTAIVRIFSAYGPGLRRQVLWDICRKALMEDTLELRGSGNESRDFIHVRDITSAIHLIAEKSSFRAEIFNLAGGHETTILRLAELAVSKCGRDIPIKFDGQKDTGNPLNWRADIGKLKKLGFVPKVSLEQGVEVYSQWCRAELIGW
jgi:UDP-glucose 4-epimerase